MGGGVVVILERIRLARAADDTDWSDLAGVQQTGPAYWDPEQVDVLVVPTDSEPTDSEKRAIRRRLVTSDAAEEARLVDMLRGHGDPQAPPWARASLAAEIGRYGNPDDLKP